MKNPFTLLCAIFFPINCFCGGVSTGQLLCGDGSPLVIVAIVLNFLAAALNYRSFVEATGESE